MECNQSSYSLLSSPASLSLIFAFRMSEHEPWDDLRVIQYVEHEHLLVARDNRELMQKLRPFDSNFYPIMVEANKQLRRRSETDDNDETQSQLSDPDDATYVEEWDSGDLMAW